MSEKPSFAEFKARRERGNAAVLDTDNLLIKRFYNLDTQAFKAGALDVPTKELLGLVASMCLRCNDCIDYHIEKCVESELSQTQIEEAMSIALLIGGSIVIPHLRHAKESLLELMAE